MTTANAVLQFTAAGQAPAYSIAAYPSTAGTIGNVLTSDGTNWISSTGGGGSAFAYSLVSGTTQAAAVGNGYIIGNSSQTTITLPATAAVGSIVAVQGMGAAGWILAANTGQTIQDGATVTSSGGSLTSANQWDTVQVVCVVADTTWSVSFVLSSGLTAA